VNRAHEATELQRQNAVNANAHLEKANARLQSANAELGQANQAISDTVAILTMQRAESQFADGHAAMGLAYLAALVRDNPSNAPAAQRLLSALVSLPEGPSHQFVFPTIRSIDLRKRAEGFSFSPDGSKIMAVVSGREGTEGIARILDAASGISCAPDLVQSSKINSAKWSQDGQWVLTASEDGSARVWDAKTGTGGVTMHHPAAVQIASFSADGRKVVTACSDGFARIWEARTGELLVSLQQQPGPVSIASFSPDGSRILTVCSRREKTFRRITCLWNAVTGEQIGEPLGPETSVLAALFSPDGDFILTVARDGSDEARSQSWLRRDQSRRRDYRHRFF
jgi:dipeptidyl aminopeptidase/acylaminoacyl peptidase